MSLTSPIKQVADKKIVIGDIDLNRPEQSGASGSAVGIKYGVCQSASSLSDIPTWFHKTASMDISKIRQMGPACLYFQTNFSYSEK